MKIYNKRLFFLVFALSVFGLLMVYSASSYTAMLDTNDSFFFLKKQIIAFVISIIFFIIAKNIDLQMFKKSTIFIYVISLVFLALVFIPGIGVENYGAKRWINLGFTSFQPSELAKFALVMMIAKILSVKNCDNWVQILKVGIVSLFTIGLIILEPNMSITMCVCFVVLIMLFVGGMKLHHFFTLLIPMIGAVVVLILIEPYRLSRLVAFIDPFASPLKEGYQLIQSYYALSGGGLFGVGLFNSTQKYLFLPFAESDFIFSIIGEEFGLIGAILVIGIYTMIIFEGIKIAYQTNDRYLTYLALGITSIVGVQTLLNVAVVSGSIPPTGLPLPFVSYGGSSLVVFMFFIGILENISKYSQKCIRLNMMY